MDRSAKSCVTVRGGDYQGLQGGVFGSGVSAESAGASRLCLHRLVLPAHTRGRPHLHEGHESAILIVEGAVEVWYGPALAERTLLRGGDYFYIPPDTPHLPVNHGPVDLVAVVARTDPREQEGVRLLDLPAHLLRLADTPTAAG
ncbi:cupin domain-containing protein [Kitasatospora sp. NPDC004272]